MSDETEKTQVGESDTVQEEPTATPTEKPFVLLKSTDNANKDQEDPTTDAPPETIAKPEKDEPKSDTPVKPTEPLEPPHSDLYGPIQGEVKYKFFGEWKLARWQPPYPTPSTLEPYTWQAGDEMWRVANHFHVPLDWLLICNRISYTRRDKVTPGREIVPVYTPNNADWYIKLGY